MNKKLIVVRECICILVVINDFADLNHLANVYMSLKIAIALPCTQLLSTPIYGRLSLFFLIYLTWREGWGAYLKVSISTAVKYFLQIRWDENHGALKKLPQPPPPPNNFSNGQPCSKECQRVKICHPNPSIANSVLTL